MEYFPIHPSNYGVTIDSKKPSTIDKDVRRKRRREEDSGEVGRSREHDGLASTSSTAVNTSTHTSPRTGEPGELNRIREAKEAASSSSKIASSSLSTTASSSLSTTASSSLSTAPSSSLSTAAPPSSATDSANAKHLEKLAAREQQRKEKRKRRIRENIAKKVGHEVDSDGERQYWQEFSAHLRAEEARREALSPEARKQEDIELSAKALRRHMEPRLVLDFSGLLHLDHYPLFVLQTAPESRNGAGCKLPQCTARIAPGQYRIALSPGGNHWASPDYYHIKCFEELLDLSSPHYVARFVPDDRKHIPDHGANCILKEYISRWKLRIQERKETQKSPDQGEQPNPNAIDEQSAAQNPSLEGQSSTAESSKRRTPIPDSPAESAMQEQVRASSNANPTDLTELPGAATEPSPTSSENAAVDVWRIGDRLWESARQNAAETSHEHTNLFDMLDRGRDATDVANALPDQDRSWQIMQYLLPESDPDYDERHALSEALASWADDVFLASTNIDEPSQELSLGDDDELIQEMRQRKTELGELSLKRIERYSVVRMPDYQSAFFGGR